jgi:hypothetical protein
MPHFKAHEIKKMEDRDKEATWFLGAINKSEFLKREILQVLHAMRNQAAMDPCAPGATFVKESDMR